MNGRAKGSVAALAALIVIIAAALLLGVQNPHTVNGQREVVVKLLDAAHYNDNTYSMNLTYSSVGIYASSANSGAWHYYNASQTVEVQPNTTYQITRFYVPGNSAVDGIEMYVTGSNVSAGGSVYQSQFLNDRIYSTVSPAEVNSTGTILLNISPVSIPVVNGASLSFYVMAYANAGAPGAGSPQSSAAQNAVGITGANVISMRGGAGIRIMLTDASVHPIAIGAVILSGNFAISGNVSGTAALNGIISSLLSSNAISRVFPQASNGLNLSGIFGIGQIGSIISSNSGFFSSVENSLPSSVRGLLSGINASSISSSVNGIVSSGTQFLSQINASSYTEILKQVVSADKSFNSSYLANNNIVELESIIGKMGGLANSSVYNGIINGVVGNEYKQYLEKAGAFLAAESRFGAVGFSVSANGTMEQASSAMRPNFTGGGLVIMPGQSALLEFNGTISAGPQGAFMETVPGNTYKIIVLGNNSAAAYAAVSR
ncbi:MAG: hypothetical protein M1321_02995 [Candidatus Marsarchaeota archaeon]|nr:hypothetical protein [Candidatus Marsarchaeota archaeon]